jgi:cytosine deaminase
VLLDIGVREGRVVALAPGLPAGMVDHDLQGRLAVPGFVETHIHLDKACILERCASERGDLSEAISEVARLKAGFTEEDVAARAARALAKCLVNGTMRMRTHVEVDPVIGLRGLEGVKRALRAYAWAMEVEICVFPQEGLLNNPGTEELMIAALRDGAGCVGAAPYTDSDPHGQIDRVFRMARDFDVDIDMHLDFSTDPGELDAEYVCRKTEEAGWGGRVAILMGRDVDHAVPRVVAPLHRMLGRGVNCSVSTNNLLNPFTPFGDGSLLRAANLFANVAQLGRREELAECLRLVTGRAARLLNLDDYGIVVGGVADLVVLDSADPALAVAELAQPVMGFKAGRPTFTRPLPTIHAPAASAAG